MPDEMPFGVYCELCLYYGRAIRAKAAKKGGVCDRCVWETKRKIERRLLRNPPGTGITLDLAVKLGKMWQARLDTEIWWKDLCQRTPDL